MTDETTAHPVGVKETASPQLAEIRVRGKTIQTPSVVVNGATVVVTGTWLKMATLHDEELIEGDVLSDPEPFVTTLRQKRMADVFTFSQKPTDPVPRHQYFLEWDNAAIIPIKDYVGWWEKLPQETRRNVRKAAKLGVDVRVVPFDDELVRGIVDIYNETPIRQGRRFWHFGKSFEAIKSETATYLERSEFIGAYHENALIGFIKLVYVDRCANIIHILSKEQHGDKRPTNALLARAVQVCADKGMSSLQYCKYVYGGNETSSLTEFKRRNGFEPVRYPRYYVPLTATGTLVMRLKLHHGVVQLLPKKLSDALRNLRKTGLETFCRAKSAAAKSE